MRVEMGDTYNIYCDESCHLENDGNAIMVLGAVWCPIGQARQIAEQIRDIKVQHGLSPTMEIKWEKVSPAKQIFYLRLIDYFFDNDQLNFRALIADKRGLRHDDFNQSHDSWYLATIKSAAERCRSANRRSMVR